MRKAPPSQQTCSTDQQLIRVQKPMGFNTSPSRHQDLSKQLNPNDVFTCLHVQSRSDICEQLNRGILGCKVYYSFIL